MKTSLLHAFSSLLLVCTVLASVNTDAAHRTADMMNCEIKVSGVFDGTPVNVVITVYDVSRVECWALKAAAFMATPTK